MFNTQKRTKDDVCQFISNMGTDDWRKIYSNIRSSNWENFILSGDTTLLEEIAKDLRPSKVVPEYILDDEPRLKDFVFAVSRTKILGVTHHKKIKNTVCC